MLGTKYATCLKLFLAVVIVMSMAGVSSAATVTYDLTAGAATVSMPDGAEIPIWGFGPDAVSISVPGPVLEAVEGDDLVVNLTNNLPDPVTIIIHGQTIQSPSPVMADGRVMSFVSESASFTFPNLKAGTYLLESGTNTSVQVQMGLYGILIVHPTIAGQAYNDPISAYDAQQALVISDIDPLLHDAVDGGDYGTVVFPSTVSLEPKYFLINGKAYPDTDPIISANGETVLLRFANAGLQTYTLMIPGLPMTVIAEDGYLLNYPKSVFSLVLEAGRTKDVIVNPTDDTRYALFDRSGNLSNMGAPGIGGLVANLLVGAASAPPTIDSFTSTPDVVVIGETSTLAWETTGAASVSIDQGLGAQPLDGSVDVTPAATTIYTLSATGPGGTVVAMATVGVLIPPTIDSFTATPDTITVGETATLSWTTTNATLVTIDQGVGGQPVDGSVDVSPTETTTYTLTATGPGGVVQADVTVTVLPMPVIDSFTASPEIIIEGGLSTLAWQTTDADSVSISPGIGAVALDGSVDVTPVLTTTYTLTASNATTFVEATATVTVVPAGIQAINLQSPPNGSLLSRFAPPTFTWTSVGGTNNRYVVQWLLSSGGPLNTGSVVSGTSWTMPIDTWFVIPSGTTIFWRVLGVDLNQPLPRDIVASDEVWTAIQP